jgi:hypothetical protein
MSSRFQIFHPDSNKQGIKIDLVKYTQIKVAILTALMGRIEVHF